MKLDFAPDTAEMLDNAGAAAVFLKKLAHPSRMMIVCALVDGERSVRNLEDGLGNGARGAEARASFEGILRAEVLRLLDGKKFGPGASAALEDRVGALVRASASTGAAATLGRQLVVARLFAEALDQARENLDPEPECLAAGGPRA